MAGYRQFHTEFWKDEWVIELNPLERYLFSYFFTNELSSISGLYKLPIRVIMNETGLDKDFILTSVKKFQEAKKIFYQDNVIWVVNMAKWHSNASPKTQLRVERDVDLIPDCTTKSAYQYYMDTGKYSMDTVSIPYRYRSMKDKDKDKDKTKAAKTAASVLDLIPDKLKTDEFAKAWTDWMIFRNELNKKLPLSTQKKQLQLLSTYHVDMAVKIIEQSITNGWQGLFPLKESPGKKPAEPERYLEPARMR